MKPSHLLIRADIGPTVGTGHVMRTAALAVAWIRLGGRASLACTRHLPKILRQRLEAQGIDIHWIDADSIPDDAIQTQRIAIQTDTSWVVLDGYQFDDRYQQIIKKSQVKLLVLDDFIHATHENADLVLNQNIYAATNDYKSLDSARLLLGPRQVLLRDEFNDIDASKKHVPKFAKNILVTFGGSDPKQVTAKCLRALAELPRSNELVINAVIGACNPRFENLKRLCQSLPLTVQLYRNVERMTRLFGQCDLAITAGGTTCYELARCSVPAIIVSTADNQTAVARSFHEHGVMIWAGDADEINEAALGEEINRMVNRWQIRSELIANGSQMVDGKGPERVARRMMLENVVFRRAVTADAVQLLNWRNEKDVRNSSIQSDLIGWDEHQAWLKRVLDSEFTELSIIENDATEPTELLGQVRFDFDESGYQAIISVSLDRIIRGQGWGSAIIEEACRKTFLKHGVEEIIAMIKPQNSASLMAFMSVGFVNQNNVSMQSQPTQRFVLTRETLFPSNSQTGIQWKKSA